MFEFNKYYLFLTLFISGASILILEILGTRILSPFFGTTLFVWSSLISVTIVFLALGYFLGGKIADKRTEFSLFYTFIFLAAISIFLIPKFDSLVLAVTDSFGPQLGPLISSLILFSIPMTLLGMLTPFAVKLQAKKLNDIGVTAGNLYAVSTIGSFFGAILVAFFLIPNFGVETILSFLSFALILISLIWFFSKKKFNIAFVLIVLILLPNFEEPVRESFLTIYKTQSIYGEIEVIENSQIRLLLVDGAIQTCMVIETQNSCATYQQALRDALEVSPDAKKALLIGLGGGIITQRFEQSNINFVAVELDPKIVFVAKKYFDYKRDAIVDDGRRFIQNTDEKYDLVVLDVYSGYSIPPHMVTYELNESIKKIMPKDGILILNTVGNIEIENTLFQRAVYKTLKQSFEFVTFGVVDAKSLGNTIFFASNKTYPIKEKQVAIDNAIVLTDDFAPVEFLSENTTERHRNVTKAALENPTLLLIE